MILTQLVIAAIFYIPFVVFIKDDPDVPPSAVAEVKYEAITVAQIFSKLKENLNFLLLLVAFALPEGSFLAITAIVSSVADPFGFTPSEISFLVFGMIFFGVAGAVKFGIILDKTGMYKMVMITNLLITVVATTILGMVLMFFTNSSYFKPLVFIQMIVAGFFATAFGSICYSYASELTFPMQPSLVNGLLSIVEQLSFTLFTLLGSYLTKEG